MNVLDGYPLPPGACFFCGAARLGFVIDTLKDVEAGTQDHRVYICAVCVSDWHSRILAVQQGLGQSPGLVPASRMVAVEQRNAVLEAQVAKLWHGLHEALPALAELVPLMTPELDPREVPA